MTIPGSTLARVAAVLDAPGTAGSNGPDADDLPPLDVLAFEAPTSLADISCWRLLTARVPLTLLLDLASSEDELRNGHPELLDEPSSLEWLTGLRA